MEKEGWRSDRELLNAVLAVDPYVPDTDAAVASLGFEACEFASVAEYWRLVPLVSAGELETRSVVTCRKGDWRGRQVLVATFYDCLWGPEKRSFRQPRRAIFFRQVVAARLTSPRHAVPWAVTRPVWSRLRPDPRSFKLENPVGHPGPQFPRRLRGCFRWPAYAGQPVPPPPGAATWKLQADNTVFLSRLVERLPHLFTDLFTFWQIDGLDMIHLQALPVGTPPLVGTALTDRLDLVCTVADTADQLITDGYGDRPYTPAWPEDSGVTERFPADVVTALMDAGWKPSDYRATTAEAALDEFRGLTIAHAAPTPGSAAGTFTLDPALVPPKAIKATRRLLLPLGALNGPVPGSKRTYLVMGEKTGNVYGLRSDDDALLGWNLDEAIIKLVRGIFSPMTHRALRQLA